MARASHKREFASTGCGRSAAADRTLCLVHLNSPLHMKSQHRVAPPWKWSSDRPIKVTFAPARFNACVRPGRPFEYCKFPALCLLKVRIHQGRRGRECNHDAPDRQVEDLRPGAGRSVFATEGF